MLIYLKGIKSVGKSAKQIKHEQNKKRIKKGNPLQLPKNIYRDEALDDRALSKAIDKANEQKVAAKCLQGGGKINTADIKQRGKFIFVVYILIILFRQRVKQRYKKITSEEESWKSSREAQLIRTKSRKRGINIKNILIRLL